MAEVMQPQATETTQDERTIALLAHMLQIMLWWIAPLAIFLIKRDSKFISFHALQVLLLQVAYLLLIVAGMFLGFGFFFLLPPSVRLDKTQAHRPDCLC